MIKHLPVNLKVEAVHKIWSGEKITYVASKYGVSRQVVYIWKKKAEEALYQALKEKKKGPRLRSFSEENQKEKFRGKRKFFSLEDKKTHRERKPSANSHSSAHLLSPRTNGKRPEKCPVCGCEKIYKNGTYVKKIQDNGHVRLELVQRYICVWCKSSIH